MIFITAILICIIIGGLTYFKCSPKAILITILLLLGAMICFFCWAASKEENYGIYYFNSEKKDTLLMSESGDRHPVAERIIQRKTQISTQSENGRSENYNWEQKENTWQLLL